MLSPLRKRACFPFPHALTSSETSVFPVPVASSGIGTSAPSAMSTCSSSLKVEVSSRQTWGGGVIAGMKQEGRVSGGVGCCEATRAEGSQPHSSCTLFLPPSSFLPSPLHFLLLTLTSATVLPPASRCISLGCTEKSESSVSMKSLKSAGISVGLWMCRGRVWASSTETCEGEGRERVREEAGGRRVRE